MHIVIHSCQSQNFILDMGIQMMVCSVYMKVYAIPHKHTQLHALQEKLVCQSVREEENETSFPELLGHLSTTTFSALEEVKALIIATEAFRGENTHLTSYCV